ncbi:MAG TPA: hypothetical protein VN081_07020 [Dongiaceae bacterium]|nr:hypothetical protein [Dongiaceae bacterium]
MTTPTREELLKLANAASKNGEHIYTNPRDCCNWQANEAWHHAASPEAFIALLSVHQAQSAGFPARIYDLLTEVASRVPPEGRGVWEDGNGEPLQDDADAALAWIAAHQAQGEPQGYPFECWSNDDGDSWGEHPADAEFVDGLDVGDTYELLAGWNSVRATYRVTKAPDDTSDDYEVECVSHPDGNAAPPSSAQTNSEDIRNQVWNGLTDSEKDVYVGKFIDYGTDFVAPLYTLVESIDSELKKRNLKRPLQAQEQEILPQAPLDPLYSPKGGGDGLVPQLSASGAGDELPPPPEPDIDGVHIDGYSLSAVTTIQREAYELGLSRAQTAPAVDLASVSDEQIEEGLRKHRLKTDGPSQLSDSFRNGAKYVRALLSRPSAPAPVSEQPAAQTFCASCHTVVRCAESGECDHHGYKLQIAEGGGNE